MQIQKQNQSNLYMLASWARNDVMHRSDRFKDELGAVHKRRRSSWAISDTPSPMSEFQP